MAQPKREVSPKRGQVYLISFDPTIGSEIKKTRPALVLQNDIANRYSPITIVAAITSKVGGKLYPTEVLILGGEGGLTSDSIILLNLIRSIDRKRLIKLLGTVKDETMQQVERALQVSLGLFKL